MAGKVPVVLDIGLTDSATPKISIINQTLESLNQRALGFNTILEQSQKKFAGLGTLSKAFGDKVKGLGMGLTAGLTLPIIGFGAAAVKSGADFEQAINDLGARTQASAGDISLMSAEARRLGLSTTFGATQAVEAMTALGKAGFSTTEILKGTAAVLNLSAAEGMGMEESANFVSDTLNQFGIEASKATEVVDILSKASGISSISIQDLQNTLKYSAPAAKRFGISLTDLSTAVATLGSLGIKGELAGTSLRSFFSTLTSDNEKIAKLQKAGYKGSDFFSDKSMTKLRSITDILAAFQKRGLSASQSFEIFGKEFGGTISSLIANVDKFDEQSKEMLNNTGFSQEVATARTRGFWGEWAKLKNAVQDTYIQITEGEGGVLDTLAGFIGKVRDLIVSFKALDPETQKFIVWGGLALAVLGPITIGVGTLIGSIGLLATGFAALGITMIPLLGGAALLAATLGVLAIGAYQLYKNWDSVVLNFNAGLDVIKELVNYAIKFVNLMRPSALGDLPLFGLDSDQTYTRGSRARDSSDPFTSIGNYARGFMPQVDPAVRSFDPSILNANALGAQRNELFVNFGGNIPPGLSVKESPRNDSKLTLDMGRAMQ